MRSRPSGQAINPRVVIDRARVIEKRKSQIKRDREKERDRNTES